MGLLWRKIVEHRQASLSSLIRTIYLRQRHRRPESHFVNTFFSGPNPRGHLASAKTERRTLNATHGRVCGFVAFKVHKAL